jgi:predicted RNase H-like nuclease
MAEQTHDQVGQIPVSGSVLGVDVGFSPTRRSSAVCRLDWNATEINLTINRFRALEPERSAVLSAVADRRQLLVAAFDGPLRSDLEVIGRYRLAEKLLTRVFWRSIGKPGQASSPVGKKLNEHANECAKIILKLDLVGASAHDHAIHRTAIVEAFPTSFLGLLIDDPKSLSARRGDRSDSFFIHLAENGLLISLIKHHLPGRHLAQPLSTITHHDDRAAVVCALTALAVAAGDYVVVGDDDDGWIVLPPRSLIRQWAWKLLQQNAQQRGLEWRPEGRHPIASERVAAEHTPVAAKP